ncbi:MAG: amino acid dehydrogenase [Bacteroidota bacterium]|nr:amino acid dehydrogenase [Bacteroidota bacterium]
MKELIKKFENKPPEIVFEWKDRETEAEGWVVINSLRGGAAGGGTRMRKGLDRHEVLSLAKTMEIKFAVAGPTIGGAKSGINFDPDDPRKNSVLDRWYKAVMPLLKTYYGTGGDLNIDEIRDVIPLTEKYGLHHPQEGVLMGHFAPNISDRDTIISQLQKGVSQPLTDATYSPDISKGFTVADMITGWGVSEAVKHFYKLWQNEELPGKRAIIQGWGNVASAAAYYLAAEGVKIVGIIDRNGGIISEQGLDQEKVRELFIQKDQNELNNEHLQPFGEVNENIWDIGADIFIPAAASRLVSTNQLERLEKAGVKIISCGANVPFADQEIFYGTTSEFADDRFAVIPDFIANCGMARTFAYLMKAGVSLEDKAIFEDVSSIIAKELTCVHQLQPEPKGIITASFERILGNLMD